MDPKTFIDEHNKYAVSTMYTQRRAPVGVITEGKTELYKSIIEALKDISRNYDTYKCIIFNIHIVDIKLNYDEVEQLLNYYHQTYPQP